MVLYASQEIHSSVQKAAELLGLGSEALRLVPANEEFQIDIQALKLAITGDRQRGDQPFCVVGAAGTANTGAIDDLQALADICQVEGLWFHVDGAFGAWAQLIQAAPELELLAPVNLNVVCFRFVKPGLDDSALDALNRAILVELQEGGIAVLSGTTVRGRYAMRVGHTNHRTRREDFELLVREVKRMGQELASDPTTSDRSPTPGIIAL